MKRIKNDILNNKKYLILASFITLFTLLPQFYMNQTVEDFLTLLSIFIFVVLLSKFSKTLFSLFIIYLNIISLITFNITHHWGASPHILIKRLDVLLLSPTYESIEYIKNYVDMYDFLLMFYVFAILVFLIKFIIYHKHNFTILKKIALVLSIILILILQDHEPIKIIKRLVTASQRAHIVHSRNEYIVNKTFQKSNHKQPIYDQIVIIQGEAVNKKHMQIYDYKYKTTPFLSSLYSKNLITKLNAISPTNQTRFSVPIIFTDANVTHWKDAFMKSPSLVSDFKQYGYNTYWISNQGKVGKDESYITSLAMEADNQFFFNSFDYKQAKSDLVIKDFLKQQKPPKDQSFYVFHLMGSHASYTQRYTKEHALFKNPKSIIEKYDNTIFFTDYIIESIYTYFSQKNQTFLLIYISDHGEVVTPHKYGHGFTPTVKDEYEIPFLIYSSIPNSRIVALEEDQKGKRLNLESFNHLVQYINGMRDTLKPSYQSQIFSLYPTNIQDYTKLKYYKASK